MSEINDVIDRIIHAPDTIFSTDIDQTILTESHRITNKDIKALFLRIYDLNTSQAILGHANAGLMGRLNRRSNKKRNKKYYRQLRKNSGSVKIYVEGDSWFQHPLIKEIFDQLSRIARNNSRAYAMKSSAMGGEWLINILDQGKYIAEISNMNPDVILLSGAGNDLVGGKKISNLLDNDKGFLKTHFYKKTPSEIRNALTSVSPLKNWINLADNSLNDKEIKMLAVGFCSLNKEFFSLLWTIELMYKYLIHNIRLKFGNTKIITQGYDYPIPSYKKGPIIYPKKFIVNAFATPKNGQWLKDALNQAKIPEKNQEAVMFTLIYCFNEVLISITKHEQIGINVFHIDSRGVSDHDISNWFDEMHLKPRTFKKVAHAYFRCIESNSSMQKVYKAKQL